MNLYRVKLKSCVFCALLIALLATIATEAAAATNLQAAPKYWPQLLFYTDFGSPTESIRYPRARYQTNGKNYFYGDMRLDVLPGETIKCSASLGSSQRANCYFTPSSQNDLTSTSLGTSVPYLGEKYTGSPDAVKINLELGDFGSNTDSLISSGNNLKDLDVSIEGVKKGGRLWSYVWDFMTPKNNLAKASKGSDLNTSFFARLPNGNPIEIKLTGVAADAFVVAGFRDPQNKFTASPSWDDPFNGKVDSTIRTADQLKQRQQGVCDADTWGNPTDASTYYSGTTAGSNPHDNNARKCMTLLKEENHLEPVALYLQKPEFSSKPIIDGLGTTPISIVTGPGKTQQCLYPIITMDTPQKLIFGKINAHQPNQKFELRCENKDDHKKYIFPTGINNGEANFYINMKAGTYRCYTQVTEPFHIVFADAEQVGSLRMYEVAENGSKIPLSLNWDDTKLSKKATDLHTQDPNFTEDKVLRLSGGGKSPIMKDGVISADYLSTAPPNCQDTDTDARCWGSYSYGGSSQTPDSNNTEGIGNADIVTTWAYYPTSNRHFFTLAVVDSSKFTEALHNGCSKEINPTDGSEVPVQDSDHDGIPDKIEGKSDITSIPDQDTDGDGKPDYQDRDSDGDGILDKVECHFEPSIIGSGFVAGCEDTDGDGTPDYLDTDSDNDGILDEIECVYEDVIGTGYIEGCVVSDPATAYIPDYRNPYQKKSQTGAIDPNGDLDKDGIPNKVEGLPDPSKAGQPGYNKDGAKDSDGDGIPDYLEPDSDNDGIPDKVEAGYDPSKAGQPGYNKDGVRDTDGDGTPDYQDTDSDGDGVYDIVECTWSATNIGPGFIDGCIISEPSSMKPDYRNKAKQAAGDYDNDGIPDKVENSKKDPSKAGQAGFDSQGNVDTNHDGTPDFKDTDSDNDDIPDNVEGGYTPSKAGQPGYTAKGERDTDGDGIPDYQDTDSDNDGIPDKVEGGYTPSKAGQTGFDSQGNVDTDGDGTPDYRDTDSDNDGVPDKVECSWSATNIGSGFIDGCIISEPSSMKPDYRNKNQQTADKDEDKDGIPDKVENSKKDPSKAGKPGFDSQGNVDTDGDGKPDEQDTDSDGDDIPDSIECRNYNPKLRGKNYVNGCPDTDGDGIPDYRDTDSNNDGTPDKDQCSFVELSQKCTNNPYEKGGHLYIGRKQNSSSSTTSASLTGIVAGGCGCSSTPDGSLPGELLLLGAVAGAVLLRRRKED